ncbi:hypothetical protein Hypma_014532 [Hypsizygus marmoreus]|uniref:Cleavage stimulation factor subunit 2 hinge domain-containing protein n=1 Tax=Hypsizygus marmoreus TaxID=39966 RepID=A0A369JHH4_HYPMA|nr:hypothetical protein Hypma_014532 [Hypsizygus marmoreus]
MQPSQLMEVLALMKAFVITHPKQARSLLNAHPQFAYALFQALLLNKIVDSATLQRMLATSSDGTQQPAPLPLHRPMPPPPHLQQPPPNPPNLHLGYPLQPPQLQQPQPYPGLTIPSTSMLPASAMFPYHQQLAYHPLPSAMPPYYQPPPPPVVPVSTPQPQVQPPLQAQMPVQPQAPAATVEISDRQRSMILQVLSMTSEQINALSETEWAAVLQVVPLLFLLDLVE